LALVEAGTHLDLGDDETIESRTFRLRFLDGIDPALLTCAHIVHS